MKQNFLLDKKRILVVEDDYPVAHEICEALRTHGASVVGPAPTVYYARLVMGKRSLDGAILDTHLFNEDSYGLATDLLVKGVPVLFAIEEAGRDIALHLRHVDTLQKPINLNTLVAKVAKLNRLPSSDRDEAIIAPGTTRRSGGPRRSETLQDRWCRALARAMRNHR